MLDSANDSPFCFPKERVIAFTPGLRANLSCDFRRLLHKHGIMGKRFHSLRHAFSLRMLAAGKTIDEIGGLLGHRSNDVTAIYLNHPKENGFTNE